MSKRIKFEDLPEDIKAEFKHYDIFFEISPFEEMLVQDIYQRDESAKIKLNRNVTREFHDEFILFHKQKRNIRYNIKGDTRDGKSYIGLKITNMDFNIRGIDFNENITYSICGNQIEYRQKLKNAKFGDFFLIDENFFIRAGLGSNIEAYQLTDYNNIIAKQNIGNIFITPQRFLNSGSVLGFSTYGRDSTNWLSRALLFKFKDGFPFLIGYVVFDIGSIFRDNGCLIYKFTGGCINSKQVEASQIDPKFIKYSWAIPDNIKSDFSLLDSPRDDKGKLTTCPFYNVCECGVKKYESLKDRWIVKELKGGLDERTYERFYLACRLVLALDPVINIEDKVIKVSAKNGKDLKNRIKLILSDLTNTKFGVAEFDEIVEIVKSNNDINFFCEVLTKLDNKELTTDFLLIDQDDLIKDGLIKAKDKLDKLKPLD